MVAEKDAADLFTLDTTGDAKNRHKVHKVKGLKADEIIAARSAVPAVAGKKRPGDKTSDGILPAKRPRTNYVTHKELVRIKKVADGHHESTVTVADATYDPWAVGPSAPPSSSSATAAVAEAAQKNEWIPEPPRAKAPPTLAKQPISLAASGKAVPAVPKPAGGYSYNPVVTEYMDRLEKEGDKALAAERKRQDAAEADRKRQEAAARSAAEAEAAEARAELSEWDEDSAWEGFESEAEGGAHAKRPKRKTPAQRNRVKRRKAEEGRLKHEAAQRRKEAQAKQIKELAEAVEEAQQRRAVEKIEMSDDEGDGEGGDEVELRRRQLGKFKLPERDLELVLPDELQESLRLLKPEGNLLKDRYRSMLVRGKMEARRKVPFHKQAKVKYTEKWTHKDFDITKI